MDDPQVAKLRDAKIRELRVTDIQACPHVILVPEHYREDGSCRCNDPTMVSMKNWGYKWNSETNMWESE
jgi:hypothetical protein